MPDILIRMEMPPECVQCVFSYVGNTGLFCTRLGIKVQIHERHPDCPLIELPPHGDLIEKDLVLEYPTEWFYDDPYISLSDIKAAPVIVPAERRYADA